MDFKKYNYDEWIVLAEKSRVDRTISSAEQAIAQVHWLAENACRRSLYRLIDISASEQPGFRV